MARTNLCSRCKQDKGPGKEHVSYCNPCKQARKKEARIQSRITRGLPLHARGTGERSPHCSDCQAIKEDIQQCYCNACRSVRGKKWALETGRVQKNQTGLCPCGAERAPNQPYFCASCKAEDSRKWRAIHRTPQEELDRLKQERDEYQEFKRSVRKVTQYYIKTGIIVKQSCEVCAVNEDVEAHHDDYNKPMEVRWLCRKHHLEHHKNEKRSTN